MRRIWIAGLVACAVGAPATARAQDDGTLGLGLDLSSESTAPKPPKPKPAAEPKAPAEAGGFGLDLSDGTDYRPAIAYLGVAVGEAGADVDAQGANLLAKLDELLSATVHKSGHFSAVLPQGEARAKLGEEPDSSLRCPDPACFEAAAAKVGAERLFLGLLSLSGGKPQVRLVGFARGEDKIESEDVVADRSAKGSAAAKLSAAAEQVLSRVAAPLGRVKISTNVPGAEISLDGASLGKGSAEAPARPGTHAVHAAAAGYVPQDAEADVEPAQTREVALTLAKVKPAPVAAVTPPERATRAAPSGLFFEKPGLYVALAGVAAAGVGVGLGMSAKGTEARAIDANGDGILDITRGEMLSAQTHALVANILVPAGLAMMAGGVTWALWPTAGPAPAPKIRRGNDEPDDAQVGVTVGGTF